MPLFDWDSANIEHIARHGVTPAEAEDALSGVFLDLDSYVIYGELRFESVGMTSHGRLLKIVSTDRNGMIRVVTALDASPALKKCYAAMVIRQ